MRKKSKHNTKKVIKPQKKRAKEKEIKRSYKRKTGNK